MSNVKDRIAQLERELADLKAKDKAERRAQHAERRAQHEAIIGTMTHKMGYDELCEFREVLNERIREQYVSDVINDE